MNYFAYGAAGFIALLGIMHLVYTLIDFGKSPKYFRPVDLTLLSAMQNTKTASAPQGRDYWSGVLGFNLSHGLGLLLFALLITVTTTHNIGWLKPVLLGTSVLYAIISDRCWFIVPTRSVTIVTVLLLAAWL